MATAILHEYDSVTEAAYYFHFHLLLSGSINIFKKKKNFRYILKWFPEENS